MKKMKTDNDNDIINIINDNGNDRLMKILDNIIIIIEY